MPLLPRNHHRSGRAPFTMLLIVLSLLAIPLILIGAAPQWWSEGHVYHMEGSSVATSSDYSPANLGQLKHFAVTAYEYLHTATTEYGDPTAPVPASPNPTLRKGGIGWRLRASLGQFVEFNVAPGTDLFAIKRDTAQNIIKRTSPLTADYAMLNQGQLKAIASLFYERLDGIYAPYPVPRPWGSDNGPANDFAPATLGQLKNTFSFDLSKDSDGDGVSDLNELHRPGSGGTSDPTNPFNSDSDSDGIADNDDTAPNDPDRDGDGFLDGEDKWPNDPRRGDYIPPKFYAVTDLSAGIPTTDPYYSSTVGGIRIDDENTVSWVANRGDVEVLQDTPTIHQTRGPFVGSFVWENGNITTSEVGDELLTSTTGNTETILRTTYAIAGASTDGELFGSLDYLSESITGYHSSGSETRFSHPYSFEVGEQGYQDGVPIPGINTIASSWDRGVRIVRKTLPKPIAPDGITARPGALVGYETNYEWNPQTFQMRQSYKIFRRSVSLDGTVSNAQYFGQEGEAYWVDFDANDPHQQFLQNGYYREPLVSEASQNGNVLIGFYHSQTQEDVPAPNPNKTWLWLADGREKNISGDGIAVNNAGQVIGVTDTSETALDTGAFFAWVDAFGTVQRMKFEDLLKWANKPRGVKDDYERYFGRTAKNGQAAEPQLRKIQPKFLNEPVPVGNGSSPNYPETILFSAETPDRNSESKTLWVNRDFVMQRVHEGTPEARYQLVDLEWPKSAAGAIIRPSIYSMNQSGLVAGTATIGQRVSPIRGEGFNVEPLDRSKLEISYDPPMLADIDGWTLDSNPNAPVTGWKDFDPARSSEPPLWLTSIGIGECRDGAVAKVDLNRNIHLQVVFDGKDMHESYKIELEPGSPLTANDTFVVFPVTSQV